MTRFLTLAAAVLTGLAAAGTATAACEYPERVNVPNGATASRDEMVDGMKAVKKFMADMDVYLACLDEENRAARVDGEDAEITAQRDAITVKRHNAAIDEMERLAASFNDQRDAFNARQD